MAVDILEIDLSAQLNIVRKRLVFSVLIEKDFINYFRQYESLHQI
jgi:hypothetical protein